MSNRRKLERLLSISINNNSINQIELIDYTNILNKLKEYGIDNSSDLFELSPYAVMAICNINYDKTIDFITKISYSIAQNKYQGSVYEIINKISTSKYLSTGCIELDKRMKGGYPIGSITEVSGPPGIGKTQLCLSCCAELLVNKSSGINVIYYDTELKFDSKRLLEIIRNRNNNNNVDNHRDFTKQITIKRPINCKELLEDIENLHSFLIDEEVSLIIIDSIAALARKENLNDSDKELYLIRQAAILKKLAELCQCVILITNQIVNDVENIDVSREVIYNNTLAKYKPALGSMWYHSVNTRLTMTARKLDSTDTMNINQSSQNPVNSTMSQNVSSSHSGFRKYLRMTKSPLVAQFEIPITVGLNGIITEP